MNFDLIVCRSLTYAQRTSVVLEREGISSIVLRAPAQLSDKGCGYAVKIVGIFSSRLKIQERSTL